jgi:hypothetical protein
MQKKWPEVRKLTRENLVVASIYGIKGTQIFRNGGKK